MSLALYWVSAARFSSQSRSAACGRQTEPAAAPSQGTSSRPRRQDVTHSPAVTPQPATHLLKTWQRGGWTQFLFPVSAGRHGDSPSR